MPPKKIIRKTKNWIADLLFPFFCLACGKEGRPICLDCQKKVSLLSFQVCPACEKAVTLQGQLCETCQKTDFPVDELIVASDYQDFRIAESVHLYKYNFVQTLAPFLGKILLDSLMKNDFPLPDFLVPVPLHPRRLRWRGFNQAQLLANFLAKNLAPGMEIPVATDWLVRQKKTASQMKIGNAEKRRANLKDAFVLKPPAFLKAKNKNILLIDDICTTGSTLIECAKELKKAKPKKISALVIARQS